MIEVFYHLYSSNWPDYEPEDYVSSFSSTIVTDDCGNMEKRVQVGEMNGYLVHVNYARERHASLYRIFDDHSMDFSTCFGRLFDKRKDDFRKGLLSVPPANEDILLIEDLIIYPKYRGSSLGLRAIMNAIKTFGLSCGVVLCQALPLQYNVSRDMKDFKKRIGTKLLFVDRKSSIAKIVKHLQKIGFTRLRGTTLCLIETAVWNLESYSEYCA
jgi:hypothetical protein